MYAFINYVNCMYLFVLKSLPTLTDLSILLSVENVI